MTGTNTKVRSIFLTVLMVLSVFAGTVAFAGSAAAAGSGNLTLSDDTAGATGVTYNQTQATTTSQDMQYLTVRFRDGGAGSAPDLSAVTASDITIKVDGVEYTDGLSVSQDDPSTLSITLANSVNVNNGDVVAVAVGDVENAQNSSATYTYNTELETTTEGQVFDEATDTYTLTAAAGGGGGTTDQDPPYERDDGDATFTTEGSQLRWAGQQLFFEGDTTTEYQVVAVGDQIAGTSDYREGNTVTAFNTDSNGRALVSTSGLNGKYTIKRSSDGNYVVTNSSGVQTNTETAISSNNFLTISAQDFSASFADNTVTQGQNATVETSSNRASYNVTVSSDDLSNDQIDDIFTDVDANTDGVQISVDNNEDTITGTVPTDFATGNFTLDFEVVDTGQSDSDYLEVSPKGQKAASFGQAVYSEERGDNATFTVEFNGGADTAKVQVGGPDVNYNTTITVTDGDDDGQVTVSWNTWRAGRNTNENTAFEATSADDSVSNVKRFTNRIPADSRLSAADYDLAVFVDGEEEDVGVITLNQRSTDAATQYVAPESASPANATELSEVSTEGSATAIGDWAVTQVEVSGIYGYTWDKATLQQNGVNVTIEQAGDTINTEPKKVQLSQNAVNVFFDDDANQFYVAVDTEAATAKRGVESGLSLKDGETYNVTFEIDGDYSPYVAADSTETVQTQFTLEDPEAEFDTAADGNVTVDSAADQQITGTTNLAPGTEITIRARATGDSPFLKSNTTTVNADGTFAGTFDFSNVSQGTQFTVTAPNQGFEDNAKTPGIVAPAPQATVSISDQTTDGTTVTVDSASLSDGGFVTIHDGSLLDGATFDSVRGTSAYLESGDHSDITVSLDTPYEEDGTVIAMPHLDTNGNEAYDFVSSDGAEDGPYTDSEGNIVLDDASLTVDTSTPTPSPTATPEPSPTPTDEPTPTPTDEPTPTPSPTDGGGPGFGLVAALIALAGAALLALRRD